MALHGLYRCLLNPSGVTYTTAGVLEIESQNAYVNIFRFLSTLTGSGEVTRIAYNIGHVNSGALGNGLGFYGESNQSGGNAWSVWRFNSGSNRPYDYYTLFQHAGGNITNGFGNTSASYGFVDTINTYPNTYRGFLGYQLVTSINPSTGLSSNPWNGTTNNDGTDSKGTPTWITGSGGDDLYVIPAHNNARTNKDCSAAVYYRGNVGTAYRYAMNIWSWNNTLCDGLAFSFFRTDSVSNNQYVQVTGIDHLEYFTYIGCYEPRDSLTGSVKAPLVGAGGDNTANRVFQNNNALLMKSGSCGIALSSSNVGNLYAGPREGILSINSSNSPTAIECSFLEKKEAYPIWLIVSGATGGAAGTGSVGLVGQITNFTMTSMGTPLAYNSENMYAVLGNIGSSIGYPIVLPWSGSQAFFTATSHTGSILF
jgi:hypothetical protein